MASRTEHRVEREQITERLTRIDDREPHDPFFWHGRASGLASAPPPRCIWSSERPPRDDHDSLPWLTASEFIDEPSVMQAKVKQLAHLLRLSRKTVLYTGAGISASVVGQAARSGTNTVGWEKVNKRTVKPTFTHRALGHLGRIGLVNSWVQQNHDGLPQKAGFPQEFLNEIHGSWYDPSNPVVKYSGTLHGRCCEWMERDAQEADLVIVLGTSLGGLNADQVATEAAHRSKCGKSLGTVCLNLQQTPQDGIMTLRLFGKSDDILRLLLRELGLKKQEIMDVAQPKKAPWPRLSRVLVPYDARGILLPKHAKEVGATAAATATGTTQKWMWLDLRERQKVKLTQGHNCVGSGQPAYVHIGAKKDRKLKNGTVRKAAPDGSGCVLRRDESESAFKINIEGATMTLGLWWLEAALRGAVTQLPVVNLTPSFDYPEGRTSREETKK